MSSGADRFFEEMLDSAKKAARKDVAEEVRLVKAELKTTKKELVEATKAVVGVAKRETAVGKAEAKIKTKSTEAQLRLEWREDDIKLAEKEIVSMLDMITKIQNEDVVTTTTTARKFVKRSTRRGYYGGKMPSIKSQALSTIKRRITTLKKKESK